MKILRMHKYRFILFSLCISFSGLCQNSFLKNADKLFLNGSYVKAIEKYELGVLDENISDDLRLKYFQKLGLTYKRIKDYENAEKWYRNILALPNVNLKPDFYYQFAQILASNGKYSESHEQFKKYSKLTSGTDPFAVKTLRMFETGIESLSKNASNYLVEYMGMNTHMSEFSPVFYKSGLVFATSRNLGGAIKRYSEIDNAPFLDLYYLENVSELFPLNTGSALSGGEKQVKSGPTYVAKPLGHDAYTPATANDSKVVGMATGGAINGNVGFEERAKVDSENFSRQLNSKFHDGPVCFFNDFSKVIFTRNSKEKGSDGFYKLKLYEADFVNNDWKNIRELPFNSVDYSCAHPSMSSDNRLLYFSSNMPGGKGGSDLYMSRYEGGTWSTPINLGDKVNSNNDEVFPFIDANGNLYFSSNGHPGLGELDIFVTKTSLKDGLPKSGIFNLGVPLNSSKDDFGITTDGERKEGFFSSNRKRGGNDDDIYSFKRIGDLVNCFELPAKVVDADGQTAISFVKFEYGIKNNGNTQSIFSDAKGQTKLCLEPDNEYFITVSAEGFVPVTKKYSTFNEYDGQPLQIELKKQLYLERQLVPLSKKVPELMASTTNSVTVSTYPSSKISSPIIFEDNAFDEPLVEDIDTNRYEMNYRGLVTSGVDRLPVERAIVIFRNQCDGTVQKFVTKADGVYEFKRELGCDYSVEIIKEKFENTEEIFKKVKTKRQIKPTIVFGSNVFREGDVVAIDKIYYTAKEVRLNKEAKRELDKLVLTLKKNPMMVVEVRSHTDSFGYSQENLVLSQKRASEVADYLTKRGIERARVQAQGYGENLLVNGCKDGVQCTDYEHARNRRTEFKIISLK